MAKTKILVTGGAGYIGSHTVHHLVKSGIASEDIIVFDNLKYGHSEYLPVGVTFVQGDLLSEEDIHGVFLSGGIRTVIHFAAYAYVGESMHEPGLYFENNVMGGVNLLEAMRATGCKEIIFSSTCATYGMPETMPIAEDTPQLPVNPYGESKLMFEKILQWYNTIYGIRSIRLRYFNACGAGYGIGENHDPETHIIPLVLRSVREPDKQISVFGTDYPTKDGTCVRDYIHVVDLAEAHFRAIGKLREKDFVTDFYNLGTGEGVSIQEIIDKVAAITGHEANVKYADRRSGDPAILVSNPAKAERELGWKAQYNIDASISDAWNWYESMIV